MSVCLDCLQPVKNEWYIVRDDVWAKTGLETYEGLLCIGCLEDRIGRRLRPEDFPHYPINLTHPLEHREIKSDRLLSRLGDNLA